MSAATSARRASSARSSARRRRARRRSRRRAGTSPRAGGVRVGVVRQRQVAPGRGGRIDRQAGDEVVDPAADGIDRDPADRAPVDAVGASGEDDVVGRAARLEAAVLPGDVGVPRGVDLGARQRARPQVAGDRVEADLRDRGLLRPARAAVGGAERGDRALAGSRTARRRCRRAARPVDRRAPWLARRRDRHAPGPAAVARRAHVLEVALAEVVELRVAVAVERAGRVVVADGPVLVEVDLLAAGGGICTGAPNVAPPSVERLTKTVGTTRLGSSGIDEIIQVSCLASYATLGSLTRSKGLSGSPGRR